MAATAVAGRLCSGAGIDFEGTVASMPAFDHVTLLDEAHAMVARDIRALASGEPVRPGGKCDVAAGVLRRAALLALNQRAIGSASGKRLRAAFLHKIRL